MESVAAWLGGRCPGSVGGQFSLVNCICLAAARRARISQMSAGSLDFEGCQCAIWTWGGSFSGVSAMTRPSGGSVPVGDAFGNVTDQVGAGDQGGHGQEPVDRDTDGRSDPGRGENLVDRRHRLRPDAAHVREFLEVFED